MLVIVLTPKGAPAQDIPALVERHRELLEIQRNDPQRPRWHFLCPEEGDVMPFDPNGAIFWKGRYHLFYIYQKSGGVHVWGHASSVDLLHWTRHGIGLDVAPGDPDRGIFSGNAFLDRDGVPTIMYHGVGVGNCIAQSHDDLLEHWKKASFNPIVPIPKPGAPGHGMFESWDPHGWFEAGNYYAIFGGRKPALMKGSSLESLKYIGPILASDRWSRPDDDVSCPDFFALGDRHALLCISHRGGARVFLGKWEFETFTPDEHVWMNWPGGTFFAPETLQDSTGRRILWAWVLDPRPDRAKRGWSGVMSLPRTLSLGSDGDLRIRPVVELERLRLDRRARADVGLSPGETVVLDPDRGASFELALEFDAGEAVREIQVDVARSPDGAETTAIVVDRAKQELRIDFRKSSLESGIPYRNWVISPPASVAEKDALVHIQPAPFQVPDGEPLRLRIYRDRSILEVFANDRICLTQRIFPTRADSTGVAVKATGGACRLRSYESWELAATNPR
jgi:sucrose-6-phosphate hydrolase SacC (GH32 family)